MDTRVRAAYLGLLKQRGIKAASLELAASMTVDELATAVLLGSEDSVRWNSE